MPPDMEIAPAPIPADAVAPLGSMRNVRLGLGLGLHRELIGPVEARGVAPWTAGGTCQRSSKASSGNIGMVRTATTKGLDGLAAVRYFRSGGDFIAAIIPAHLRAQETAASLIGNTGCIFAA